MDTLGGIAIAGEPALISCMREKPKARDEARLNKYMKHQIALLGAFTVGLCIFFLKSERIFSHFDGGEGGIAHLTAFFALLIFAAIFNCFNSRTDSVNLFKGISKNPAFVFIMLLVSVIQIAFVYLGGGVLRTCPIAPGDLIYTMSIALTVLPFELLRKILWRISKKRGGF